MSSRSTRLIDRTWDYLGYRDGGRRLPPPMLSPPIDLMPSYPRRITHAPTLALLCQVQSSPYMKIVQLYDLRDGAISAFLVAAALEVRRK